MAQLPDPQSAEALVGALPLLDVDWELVSDQDFRALLAALNFEASYDPTKRELTIFDPLESTLRKTSPPVVGLAGLDGADRRSILSSRSTRWRLAWVAITTPLWVTCKRPSLDSTATCSPAR